MTADAPPTSGFDQDLIKRRVVDVLDCADEDAPARLDRVLSLVTTDLTYVAVTGAFALVVARGLTRSMPCWAQGLHGVFGVDPVRAAGSDPDEVRFNQVIAAAANRDHHMMHALLFEVCGQRGPQDTPEAAGARAGHILAQLALHARRQYQATPLDERAALL